MPTYDYQCQTCRNQFSAVHKISDAPPSCPSCGGGEVKKLLSAPAVLGSASKAAAPQGPGCGAGGCGCKH